MSSEISSEETPPAAVTFHKLWNIGSRKTTVFDELSATAAAPANAINIFVPEQGHDESISTKGNLSSCSDPESDCEPLSQEDVEEEEEEETSTTTSSSSSSLELHELAVMGMHIDPRIMPGFKYYVKPIDQQQQRMLFEGRPLMLQSIGRGYAQRFTFQSDANSDNYFWNDSRPEGFIFQLEVVSVGDKFTVFDANHIAQGTLEVLSTQNPQKEIDCRHSIDAIEKSVKIKITAKVEYYETGVAKPLPVSGTVRMIKKRNDEKAEMIQVCQVSIGARRKGFILKAGIERNARRITVHGKHINDIPTKYTMTGLQPYELPVVGTYIDPRIVPGFYYRIRPNDRTEHLFEGRALRLNSIGKGYAKRLTFQTNNYFWSDSHPDGIGLEPRAVHTGMKFKIVADGKYCLGEAKVFRADLPQREERQQIVENSKQTTTTTTIIKIVKYIHVDVICHVHLSKEDHLMKVYGLAIVEKMSGEDEEAKIVRLENVALDSQLNILFARTHTELEFHPF